MAYQHIQVPDGEKITIQNGQLQVPDRPIIGFIEGDGTGPDIWRASQPVLDAAVERAYRGQRKIAWAEIYAGEKANAVYGRVLWLPEETLDFIREYRVAIKGPLTTPVGAVSAASTWPCAKSSTSTPACGPCSGSRGCRARCATPSWSTW